MEDEEQKNDIVNSEHNESNKDEEEDNDNVEDLDQATEVNVNSEISDNLTSVSRQFSQPYS